MSYFLKANVIFGMLLFAIILSSCGNHQSSKSENEKLRVLSSFSIISDMVQTIGKDKVEVHNLVPVGMKPHEHQPKPDDVKFATHADIIIYNGLNLEGGEHGWLMKLAHSVKMPKDRIFVAAQGVKPIYFNDEKGVKEVNPHAFISPIVGIKMAENIRNALITADKKNKTYYEVNAKEYIDRLRAIDAEYRNKIAEIPKQNRVLFASELAFQYMTREYGLEEGFIWAIDTDKNGTPDQIKSAISFIKTYHPPTLFVESNVDRRPMETVSRETGVPIYKHPILSDELGRIGQNGDTYIKFLTYNLEVIYDGLKD